MLLCWMFGAEWGVVVKISSIGKQLKKYSDTVMGEAGYCLISLIFEED